MAMQGEFGREDLPVRPELRHVRTPAGGVRLEWREVCPQGHAIGYGEAWVGRHPLYRLPRITCRHCWDAGERARAEWVVVDPYQQVSAVEADLLGVQLVAGPPPVVAGTGRIEVRRDGRTITDLDVTLCGQCRCGVIEHVRTDPPHRRRGYGWTAVTAALVRGPGYTWSTTEVSDSGARAFWSAIGFADRHTVGSPEYCPHMREAWEQVP